MSAIREQGGDVLKFMGGGLRAVFKNDDEAEASFRFAVWAAELGLTNLCDHNDTNAEKENEPIEFVVDIDFGGVTFGNIVSPDCLGFTVIGRL